MINNGTEKQLRELKTVGPGRAKSIVKARQENRDQKYNNVSISERNFSLA